MSRFILTRHGRIWWDVTLPANARSIVFSVSGSGEYRTLGTWSAKKAARWFHSHGHGFCAFDKFGCGQSEGDWEKVTVDILSEVYCDLISILQEEFSLPVIYYGQSEGAKIGFEVACADPGAVAYILKVPSHQDIKSRIIYQLGEMTRDPEALDDWLQEIQKIEEKLNHGSDVMGFMHGHARSYWASCLNRTQPGDLVSSISKPMFVLNGDADPFTPRSAFEAIHKAIVQHAKAPSCAKTYSHVGHDLTQKGKSWGDSDAAQDILDWINEVLETRL